MALCYTVVRGLVRAVATGISDDVRQQVERGVAILRQGGVVAYPTDTVYGLGASVGHPDAVARVYRLKGRPRNVPLPLLLASTAQIGEVAGYVPPVAWKLAESFLPGGLTLVLLKSAAVPDIITAGGRTIAVRVPDHPVPVALIEGIGMPIVGTSANLSRRSNSLTAGEVYAQFEYGLDLVIDGGRCPGGQESTVVDVTGERALILREGAVSRAELEGVCDVA